MIGFNHNNLYKEKEAKEEYGRNMYKNMKEKVLKKQNIKKCRNEVIRLVMS